jgi:hypothetical protein
VADHLATALLQIAEDALDGNRAFIQQVGRTNAATLRYEPDDSRSGRKSLGAFVVASDWHHKLLDRTPGSWMIHARHDFIGVSLSSAFAIFATECLHHEALAGEPRLQELLDKSVANLFRGLQAIYPEAKLREVWNAAFALKKNLRSSREPKAVDMRVSLAQLILNDALNRVSRQIPADKIEKGVFGLYDALRRAVEPKTA